MLRIKTENAVAAWENTFLTLLEHGSPTDNDLYYRDELVAIELEYPSVEPSHPLFPMSQSELNVINRFIVSGERESEVSHEWTKLYFHRLFDEPFSQVRYFLAKLAQSVPAGEAVMSLWDKTVDQNEELSPCTLLIWGRRKHGELETHVHAHSSDAYKKLLMNLQEFIALHVHLAEKLNLKAGRYYHIIDSCHIHCQDERASKELAHALRAGKTSIS